MNKIIELLASLLSASQKEPLIIIAILALISLLSGMYLINKLIDKI